MRTLSFWSFGINASASVDELGKDGPCLVEIAAG
jgi:hypothetical protein